MPKNDKDKKFIDFYLQLEDEETKEEMREYYEILTRNDDD